MTYVHCVFFTCKAGTPANAIAAQIADAQELLGKIPTVRVICSGGRDIEANRPVSVTDFDIGLVVIYDNKADYQVYADHPLHMEYLKRHKENWEQLRVFDYIC
ncbi:MAG: Dabb family protein [Phycisphaerae bacterium]|nr:Dabb family protein [Phycisphaerae bacterium]